MVPEPDELPEPVVSRFDAFAGERGIERVDAAFEFLYPAFNTVSDPEDANGVADTERLSAASVSDRPIGDHHLREVVIEFLDLFEKSPRLGAPPHHVGVRWKPRQTQKRCQDHHGVYWDAISEFSSYPA